jgi:hypothetical protein
MKQQSVHTFSVFNFSFFLLSNAMIGKFRYEYKRISSKYFWKKMNNNFMETLNAILGKVSVKKSVTKIK